ncbi:UbiA family prenyltransferase [Amniculibacterium sp. G2-70]|uniref:UbiA family prenyltransferase n=1 Tax=Amniculibacterium sp. G2-70 TaxID=2767188 RepID=UPI00165484D0|nr:UbiA family prenyltransferase [Amniculibacterium sp. G2-70]
MENKFLYRLSQLLAFVLGTKLLMVVVLTFALYVSTFFLFNQEESLRAFAFDFRVHAIIFCAIVSIGAGGIINQFYDKEKDKITRPFRTKLQSFLKQKYFLYAYVFLNSISLAVAGFISVRVLIFFLFYQFLIWFYSHKISKILILNNLTFVSLSLYPFFGMLIYYQTFSIKIVLMATFLFGLLLVIDIIKDSLTKHADAIFGYHTLPNTFKKTVVNRLIISLLVFLILNSILIVMKKGLTGIMSYYYLSGILIFIFSAFLLVSNKKNAKFYTLNILRFWIFIGILAMLFDGIIMKW